MVVRLLLAIVLLAGSVAAGVALGDGQGTVSGDRAPRPVETVVVSSRSGQVDASIPGSIEISDASVWINQAVYVTLRIESESPYVSLDAGDVRLDGMDVQAQAQVRHPVETGRGARTVHQLSWVIFPHVIGEFEIELPPVRYRRDGVVTHLIHVPGIPLHVRPLPAFVPPTLPIGRMGLDVSLPKDLFLVKHKLNFLELAISTRNPPGRKPVELLRQLRSDEALTFYPPRNLAGEDGEAGSGRDEMHYQVPFASGATGWVPLPTLRLQYFDTATGKIVTEDHPLGGYVAIAQWMIHTGAVLLLLIVAAALRYLYRGFKRHLHAFRSYRAALNGLARAETPADLKSALMHIAVAESWPANLTLLSWLRCWARRYPRKSRVADAILRLQDAHYGGQGIGIEELRAGLMDTCYERMPILRIIGS